MTPDDRKVYMDWLEHEAEADAGFALRLRNERLAEKVGAGLAQFETADVNGYLKGEKPPTPPTPADGDSV